MKYLLNTKNKNLMIILVLIAIVFFVMQIFVTVGTENFFGVLSVNCDDADKMPVFFFSQTVAGVQKSLINTVSKFSLYLNAVCRSNNGGSSVIYDALPVWCIFAFCTCSFIMSGKFYCDPTACKKRLPILALPIGGKSPPVSTQSGAAYDLCACSFRIFTGFRQSVGK